MATISPAIAAPPCSAAPSFLDVLGTGSVAAPVELDCGAVVAAGALPPTAPVLYVEFSWKIPGSTVGYAELELELGLELEDGADHEDDDVRLEEAGAEELEATLLELGGAGFDDVEEGAGAADDLGGEELEGADALEPSVLNTTMLADLPLGTVTTQKLAPPTPSALTGLSTPFTSMVEGSILHGTPLHPPSGHSILTPYVGLTLLNAQSV